MRRPTKKRSISSCFKRNERPGSGMMMIILCARKGITVFERHTLWRLRRHQFLPKTQGGKVVAHTNTRETADLRRPWPAGQFPTLAKPLFYERQRSKHPCAYVSASHVKLWVANWSKRPRAKVNQTCSPNKYHCA